MKRFLVSATWSLWMALLTAQIVLSSCLYNPGGPPALRILLVIRLLRRGKVSDEGR